MNQDVTLNTTPILPAPTAPGAGKKPRRGYQSHGFTHQLRGRSKTGRAQIDGRSALGRALADWKAELIDALGGPDNISPQERVLIETCVRDHMILSSIDAWLMTQPSLIHAKKRQAYPIVLQRVQIADSLTRRLQSLGLKRRAKPVNGLADLLAGKTGTQGPSLA